MSASPGLAGWPVAARPSEIETALSDIWAPSKAERAQGNVSGDVHYNRVCLGTLMFLGSEEFCTQVHAALPAIMRKFPSRALVVAISADDDEVPATAAINAQCYRRAADAPQVCGEVICLRIAHNHRVQFVRGLTLPLFVPDLPVFLMTEISGPELDTMLGHTRGSFRGVVHCGETVSDRRTFPSTEAAFPSTSLAELSVLPLRDAIVTALPHVFATNRQRAQDSPELSHIAFEYASKASCLPGRDAPAALAEWLRRRTPATVERTGEVPPAADVALRAVCFSFANAADVCITPPGRLYSAASRELVVWLEDLLPIYLMRMTS